MSNTTNVTLSPAVYSGSYATLMIQGSQANNATNATGATVAEWAIIGSQNRTLPVGGMDKRRSVDVRRMLRE